MIFDSYISQYPTASLLVCYEFNGISEKRIVELFSKYGNLIKSVGFTYLTIVEFSEVQPAEFLYNFTKQKCMFFDKTKLTLYYSSKNCDYFSVGVGKTISNLLELNISNLKYNIDVDVIKSVTFRFGIVTKIYVGALFNQSINVYVEFEKVCDSILCRDFLDNKSIYDDSCNIVALFSLIEDFQIDEFDKYSWSLELERSMNEKNKKSTSTSSSSDSSDSDSSLSTLSSYNVDNNISTSVFLCKNLSSEILIEYLYNLFSLNGNVLKMHYYEKPQWEALIQMDSSESVRLCKRNYDNQILFGTKINIIPINKTELIEPKYIKKMSNRSLSYVDCFENPHYNELNLLDVRNSRLTNVTKTIHFYNTPEIFSEDALRSVFRDYSAPQPDRVALFRKAPNQKHSKGLMQFHSIEEAFKAICIMNNRFIREIEPPGKRGGTIMKMVFSSREFVKNEEADVFRQNNRRKEEEDETNKPNNRKRRHSNSRSRSKHSSNGDRSNHGDNWNYNSDEPISDKENTQDRY